MPTIRPVEAREFSDWADFADDDNDVNRKTLRLADIELRHTTTAPV